MVGIKVLAGSEGMGLRVTLGVADLAVLDINHQVLEVLDHCVFPFFGIENGVVQVLGNLDGLFDGELVSSLGKVIASHLGESDGLGGKAL